MRMKKRSMFMTSKIPMGPWGPMGAYPGALIIPDLEKEPPGNSKNFSRDVSKEDTERLSHLSN